MKTIHLILLFSFLFCLTVQAQKTNNMHRGYIDIGYVTGTYSNYFAPGVYGGVGVYFETFGRPAAFDIRSKESYVIDKKRQIGAITFSFRSFVTRGLYLGIGGAHNHEIGIKHLEEDPAGAILANNKHIDHRSGMVVEAGYDFRSFIKQGKLGIYPHVNLSYAHLFGDYLMNPYINLTMGFRFGFKQIDSMKN